MEHYIYVRGLLERYNMTGVGGVTELVFLSWDVSEFVRSPSILISFVRMVGAWSE